jgi:hypothetical protein
VQWQVLRIFALADHLGIDWGKIDPGIDWHLFQKGVTIAALRWMLDHQDANHQAPPSRSDAPRVAQGLLDTCFYDRFDCVQGEYGGPLILPDPIAVNLEAVLGWK